VQIITLVLASKSMQEQQLICLTSENIYIYYNNILIYEKKRGEE